MNKQKNKNLESKILEFVKNQAIAQNIVNNATGAIWTNVKVLYPNDLDDSNSRYYAEDFKTPNTPERMKKCLAEAFASIVGRIIRDINYPTKRGITYREIVYKVCPQMLCGDNPCSCKEE
jgi:hypothetical protein